jgi:hypothetical protein
MYNDLKVTEFFLHIFFNSLVYDLIKSKATNIKIMLYDKKQLELLFFHNSLKLPYKNNQERSYASSKNLHKYNGFSYFNYLHNIFFKDKKFISKFNIKIIHSVHNNGLKIYNKIFKFYNN